MVTMHRTHPAAMRAARAAAQRARRRTRVQKVACVGATCLWLVTDIELAGVAA